MEFVIAAFNGCKSVMISLIAKEMNFNFSGVEFDATGIIDIQGLMGVDGVSPHFQGIRFFVNIRTSESEERIQQLKAEVERRCPVFNLFKDAGIKIDARWNKLDLI